jgi:hypothetical protein
LATAWPAYYAEANEINNTAAAVMRIGPDVIASTLAAPSSAVSGAEAVGSLDPGGTDFGPIELTLPAGLPSASFYLIAVADGEAQVAETMEGNNSRAVLVRVTAAP